MIRRLAPGALLLLTAAAPAQPPQYMLTVIDNAGERSAWAISPGGSVAAGSVSGSPALMHHGGLLHSFASPAGGGIVIPHGINDSGVMVGFYDEAHLPHPFIADPLSGLRPFSPLGGDSGIANDITSSGLVVGAARSSPTSPYVAFRWRNGVGEALPLPPGAHASVAAAVSEGGLIVGSTAGPQATLPTVWQNDTVSHLSLPAGYTGGAARAVGKQGWSAASRWERAMPSPFSGVMGFPRSSPRAARRTTTSKPSAIPDSCSATPTWRALHPSSGPGMSCTASRTW